MSDVDLRAAAWPLSARRRRSISSMCSNQVLIQPPIDDVAAAPARPATTSGAKPPPLLEPEQEDARMDRRSRSRRACGTPAVGGELGVEVGRGAIALRIADAGLVQAHRRKSGRLRDGLEAAAGAVLRPPAAPRSYRSSASRPRRSPAAARWCPGEMSGSGAIDARPHRSVPRIAPSRPHRPRPVMRGARAPWVRRRRRPARPPSPPAPDSVRRPLLLSCVPDPGPEAAIVHSPLGGDSRRAPAPVALECGRGPHAEDRRLLALGARVSQDAALLR